MASRGFFGHDPYDYYYYTSPYHYPSSYYSHHQHQPAHARRAGGFFPVAGDADQYYGFQHEPAISRGAGGFFPSAGDFDPFYHPAPARRAGGVFSATGNVEPAATRAAVRPKAAASRSVSSIPVRLVSSDPEPENAMTMPVKRASPSAEEAAVRVQAAARGFLARRAVRALRAVEREAEEIGEKVARDAAALRGDAMARVAVGEQLMRLLLRLDAVRGARDYRRRVAKRVLQLQDDVDALEPRPVAAAEEGEADAAETSTVDTVVEGSAVAADLLGTGEDNGEMGEKLVAEMEVDGDRAAAEEAAPAAVDGANLGGDLPADEGDAEAEWEMVADEPAAAAPAAPRLPAEPREQPREGEEVSNRPVEADGGADTKKLMEMVAALCEQSAQQCAVIGALADRVDALERAVRRVEDAERRRRRAKKTRKEGRGSNHSKCYSD